MDRKGAGFILGSVDYVGKTNDEVFFMENLSFNGMCLLELRVGFSWGGSVGCLFYILFPGSNGCRPGYRGGFFFSLFYFKSI